jgi:Family of unknown function (DUF6364)
MTTKLTLSINEEVVESAKKYAKKKGTSLSGIVENYLKSISTSKSDTGAIAPLVKKMMGTLPLPKNFDYKTALKKAIGKKYSK